MLGRGALKSMGVPAAIEPLVVTFTVARNEARPFTSALAASM